MQTILLSDCFFKNKMIFYFVKFTKNNDSFSEQLFFL